MEKPPFFIALKNLAESSVDIVVRAWTKSSDFWDVFFDMNEKVYKLFPEHGLSIPYNSIDVNLVNISNKEEKDDRKGKSPSRISSASIEKSVKGMGNETSAEDNSILKDDIKIDSGDKHSQTLTDSDTGGK